IAAADRSGGAEYAGRKTVEQADLGTVPAMAALEIGHHPVADAVGDEGARAGCEGVEAEGLERPETLEGAEEGDVDSFLGEAGEAAQRLAHREPHQDRKHDAGNAD